MVADERKKHRIGPKMSTTTTRDTLFGLPRYVLAILRHMEAHSERLKWSLAEETNQLTLTLTWNFDSAKPRKTKVQLQPQYTGGGERAKRLMYFGDNEQIGSSCSRYYAHRKMVAVEI